ncbi:aminopeptidase N [Desulfocicer vacuolatum DSM 3385]|uniref:Aminopeptidase N n=1 Tax=Desulfocicer vacuolatum DSM 3385 TaxID=1121400 RepID=A0A1W2AI47_9BACT|nr:aminopeptidase N [Desulfocicer vacuolatum]SMC60347.1 aminopeptidase N [Desulfocicer vacuolatum DSM 3385]
MKKHEPKYLKDYRPPAYWIDTIDLQFDLYEKEVIVTSFMKIQRNNEQAGEHTPLVLNCQDADILHVVAGDMVLLPGEYERGEDYFKLNRVPEQFTLEIKNRLTPQNNTSLEGLYKSSGTFCTQCEAEGFRKITCFSDRPDVMSRFSCIITADENKYPVLLSNGNLVKKGKLENNRHYVKWEDPFKKPSYLFALVAGDLVCIKDTFTTCSGREIDLHIYVEAENKDKCGHAMASLKQSMAWDEQRFGREYDLDLYQIVAVNDFNMGAMENKGLNVFNSKYVLARPETATDQDFMNIQGVIGHEYFHNWTGNRVTLQNWFQLSLKEGLTVFRDQEFTADLNSRAVKRISDVKNLRTLQFPEDAGPMSHPVRPESYIEMNNFYTMTVYEKGAEVIRMIHEILGREIFRKGMDLYFHRFDGRAVTTEDFIQTMEDAAGVDLSRFRLWYSQSGTPRVTVRRTYNEKRRQLTIKIAQTTPPDHNQQQKKALHIPIKFGLLDKNGKDITPPEHHLLELKSLEKEWVFDDIPSETVPSLFRGFSAPVIMDTDLTCEELSFLMAHDNDAFNRWDAAQQLYFREIDTLISGLQSHATPTVSSHVINALEKALKDPHMDRALMAKTITLPDENEIGEKYEIIDVDAIHSARQFLRQSIAKELEGLFMEIIDSGSAVDPKDLSHNAMAHRSLVNAALSYVAALESPQSQEIIYQHFISSGNMTREIFSLTLLCDMTSPFTGPALEQFYEKWHTDPLVMDKWFSVQAGATVPGTLDKIKSLCRHPDFTWKNPNRIRSLIGVFGMTNPFVFHQADGAGYQFFADKVIDLDKINPQITARMVSVFNRYKRYDARRRELMKNQLKRIHDVRGLSRDVYEIVSRALGE